MDTHLHREIVKLKDRILEMSSDVEQSLAFAEKALMELDADLALEVKQNDKKINQEEVDIEEECLKILALYQPVAGDLRLVVSVLKINSDLERIGDICANVCKYVIKICRSGQIEIPEKFRELFSMVASMLNEVVTAFIDGDVVKASQIIAKDKEVNSCSKSIMKGVRKNLKLETVNTDSLLYLFTSSRALERAGDYVTNIAEDICYMTSGQIVRHDEERMADVLAEAMDSE